MLSQSDLKTGFLTLFDPTHANFAGYPPDLPGAAANFARVYDDYASAAVNAGGDRIITANKALFESTFLGLIVTSTSAATCAAAFGAAFVAYWTGAAFGVDTPPPEGVGGDAVFSKAATSLVTAVVPTSLQTALMQEMLVPSTNADAKAASFAAAFHTATTSSVVVLTSGLDTTPPPAGPLPITNTAGIS